MSEVIEGWKCEVVGGGYRRASWTGVVVMLMEDGRLSCERANVPARVVAWLVSPLIQAAAMRGGEVTIATIREYLDKAGIELPPQAQVKP